MNRLVVSFTFTLLIVTVLFLSMSITGVAIIEHFEWVSLPVKSYYLLCFTIAWFSVYKAMKADYDYTQMINELDAKLSSKNK